MNREIASLLDLTIDHVSEARNCSKQEVMELIHRAIKREGLWDTARYYGLLNDDSSAEDFFMIFANRYNKIYPGTY